MNWKVWSRIEEILLSEGIKPLVAIVPDNLDKKLEVAEENPQFWERARFWQERGWTIALHGFQHRYVNEDGGMLGINRQSEFAGLSETEQESKLERGLEIFRREGIQSSTWIAPSHSFDDKTLRVLKRLGIRTVSDGFFLWPGDDENGMTWIPQQLWGFCDRPFGLWTVCLHINGWGPGDLRQFEKDVQKYRAQITSVQEAISAHSGRKLGWSDALICKTLRRSIRVRKVIRPFHWLRRMSETF